MYLGGGSSKRRKSYERGSRSQRSRTVHPRELVAAYKQFEKLGPQHLDAESGIKAAAYRFGERVLIVYEESETGVVILIHPSASKVDSPKS